MDHTYLNLLRHIKSVSMATVDSCGCPQVRTIDVMLVENNVLYFCTARGKEFYRELIDTKKVAILAMTEQYQTIRLNGAVEHIAEQKEWIDKIFDHNPVMNNVYPGQSRYILEPFCIRDASIEYFDLSSHPVNRMYSVLGEGILPVKGFEITDTCIACHLCAERCPQQCIEPGDTYHIQQQHCLHCGLCSELCPVDAIRRRLKP